MPSKCSYQGCSTYAHYGYPIERKALSCAKHKLPGHVNLHATQCEEKGCLMEASYGVADDNKRRTCKKHKKIDFVYLKGRRCQHQNCLHQPSYAPPDAKKPLTCQQHRQIGYVDIINKNCEQEGCQRKSNYGVAEDKIYRSCAQHKKDNYVLLTRTLCEHTGCKTIASRGPLFGKDTHCSPHGQHLYPKNLRFPQCATKDCVNKPCYADATTNANYPVRCEICCLDSDVNVCLQKCSSCDTVDWISKDGRCNICLGVEVRVLIRKHKELRVKYLLDEANVIYKHDKRPSDSCGLERPDFEIIMDDWVIILECDEHQHSRSRQYLCEGQRMVNIASTYDHRSVMFIRYNPDNYLDHENRKCKGNSPANEKRLMLLLEHYMANKPEAQLSAKYLCYNGDDGINVQEPMDFEEAMRKQSYSEKANKWLIDEE